LLESLSYRELQELSHNEDFVKHLELVESRFDKYMAKAAEKPYEMVAYFSRNMAARYH